MEVVDRSTNTSVHILDSEVNIFIYFYLLIIIILFREDNIFGGNASLIQDPQLQRITEQVKISVLLKSMFSTLYVFECFIFIGTAETEGSCGQDKCRGVCG